MPVSAGTRLGSYEVLSLIGAGGEDVQQANLKRIAGRENHYNGWSRPLETSCPCPTLRPLR